MSKTRVASIFKKPFRRWIRPALIAAPVVAILVALLVLQPWGVSLGPRSVIAEAHAATAGLQSYRMLSSTTSTFDGKTTELTFELEFAAPDRYHAKMTLNGKTHEFTIIEDKQYTREPGSAQSGNLYAISLSGSIWSKEDTLKLLDTLTNLEKLPDEGIEGIDCVHYRGGADVDRAVDEQVANLDPAQPGYEEMLEAMERARQTKIEIELWIGKDDYLIRQMKFDTQAPPEDIGGWDTSSSMVRYYDFDKPIKIEPPVTASGELLPGWRLVSSPSASVPPKEMTFSRDVTYTIGDDDPAHQQISFRIIITNVGDETASNVRLALATKAANEEKGWIWNSPDQVTLEKGESKTYHITWEYDASHTSKEELARLLNQTTVLARYTTPEGGEVTQLLFPDAPYPSKRPPKTPPG